MQYNPNKKNSLQTHQISITLDKPFANTKIFTKVKLNCDNGKIKHLQ